MIYWRRREWAKEHIHHGAELDQFGEAYPADSRALDYLDSGREFKVSGAGDSGIGSSGDRYPVTESDHS